MPDFVKIPASDDEPDASVSVGVDPVNDAPRFQLTGETVSVVFNESGAYSIERRKT